ncbi:nitroreductase family protein [Mycoplasmopsis agassizii]|uniref:Nitroreductase domain-containing protein n=1 Tax=Mycoplasmopsis agassizii TaxID=33922 RepID=A0A1W1X4P7_9BACT|nr:nitroreductase family protein [Mycoplasmopsis agassizii]PAF55439.1 hypothetical protein CJF60_02015 [Mycoplasmopsis agassizii]PAK21623.1 hypothetical protein CJJ23_00580 [Mycoplasmopsis agassizii]SMC18431.1 Nitroreductase [Mycoplasmopsis agassizii]
MPKNNNVIDYLINRHSQRSMTYEPINEEDMELISQAMNAAPTSANKFDATAIIITNQDIKEEMYRRIDNPTQEHYLTSSALIVFFADINRGRKAAQMIGTKPEFNTLDNLLNSWGDAFIMAQNAVIAAESLGYGTVFLGGIRHFDFPWLLQERFNLPKNLFPVIAIAIGKNKEPAIHRPRLNRVYWNGYSLEKVEKEVEEFNEEEKKFWESQGKTQDWVGHIAKYYTVDPTAIYQEYLRNIYDPDKDKNRKIPSST